LIVINSSGKIIFQKRPASKEIDPEKLAFFGGHVESGESVKEAAKRELEEELLGRIRSQSKTD